MGPHMGIWERVRSVIVSKPSLNVRFPQTILNEMESLVDNGDYTSLADIVNRAVIELLQREGLRPMVREEIRRMKEKEEIK